MLYKVSIHAPVRMRPLNGSLGNILGVSIHAPVRMRLERMRWLFLRTKFQFTHPWGCDRMGRTSPRLWEVSIHAPVRMRRRRKRNPPLGHRVSIHAPVRMRRIYNTALGNVTLFQFTHPWGCDPCLLDWLSVTLVSIHAPVRMRL